MKEAMQKLNIAKEMLKEGIDERHHRMIEGYTDLKKTNVCINTMEEDRNGGGDPEDRHITHTITSYIDNITYTCLTKPSKKGLRAKPIDIPKSDGEVTPMELHKTREEPSAQHNTTQ